MVDIILKKMFTLTLIITTICLYGVNSADVRMKRHPTQYSICSGDPAELLASPWYGVPRSTQKSRPASRRYRDTEDQQRSELSSSSVDGAGKNKTAIAKIDLSEATFGEGNFDEKSYHGRKERSSLQEFEFGGKRYVLRRKNAQSSIDEMEPQESAPVATTTDNGKNTKRLLMLYNGVQKLMQMMDPTKTIYENFEDAVFDIFQKIIYDKMITLFEDSISGGEESENSKNGNGRQGSNDKRDASGTERSEPKQPDFSLSVIGKQILGKFKPHNQNDDRQSTKSSSLNGDPDLIVTGTAAASRYVNHPSKTSDVHASLRNQENYVNRPNSLSQQSMASSRPFKKPTDQLSPGSIVTNIEESSSITRNGRSPISGMEIGDVNRDLYNRRLVGRYLQKWPMGTQKREIHHTDQRPTPPKYVTLTEPLNAPKDAGFVRLARSERPTKDLESPELATVEKTDKSSDPEQPEKPKDLDKPKVSDTDDSMTFSGSTNVTSVSDRVEKALEELFGSDQSEAVSAETIEVIKTLLDQLRETEPTAGSPTAVESPLVSPTEKPPTIGKDDPK